MRLDVRRAAEGRVATRLRCSLDLMVAGNDRGDDAQMTSMKRRLTPAAPLHGVSAATAECAAAPDQEVVLYEQAAELLASAGALKAAAHAEGAGAALGPTLACLEASFDALVGVAEQLGSQAVSPLSAPGVVRADPRPATWEVERRFRVLIDAAETTRAACASARDAVRPPQAWARLSR